MVIFSPSKVPHIALPPDAPKSNANTFFSILPSLDILTRGLKVLLSTLSFLFPSLCQLYFVYYLYGL